MNFDDITFACSLLLMNISFVFNRFHYRSMTKKLCGPLAYWLVTKWPAIANRFVTPAITGCNCILAIAQPQISDKHVYDSTLYLIMAKPNEMQMKQKILNFSL